jgi:hypothetical protein
MTGWISWFALFRVLVQGLYMLYRSFTNSWGPGNHQEVSQSTADDSGFLLHDNVGNPGAGAGEPPNASPLRPSRSKFFTNNVWPPASVVRSVEAVPQIPGYDGRPVPQGRFLKSPVGLNRDVTALGWIGWIYGALYAPITQGFWIAANIGNNNGATKIVKGMTIAVSALPLGIDCRVRYADSLKQKWASTLFNLANSVSCVFQGVFCAILLVHGVIDLKSSETFGFPWPLVAIYPVFSLLWMLGSFALLPMRDGGRKRAGQAHWAGYIFDIGMGAFAGLFLAAPAFGLYQSAQFDKTVSGDNSDVASDLGDYLNCESQLWRKFAAVVP